MLAKWSLKRLHSQYKIQSQIRQAFQKNNSKALHFIAKML